MADPAPVTVAAPDPNAAVRSQRQISQAAGTTINVSALPKGDPTVTPPKPGSAKARLFSEMNKQFGGEEPQGSPPSKPVAPATEKAPAATPPPTARPTTKQEKGTGTPAGDTELTADRPAGEGSPETAEVVTPETPETDKSGKRLSPWKLVDAHKAARAKAEQESLQYKARIAELEKQVVPQERIKAYEQELETLRGELRYYNAEKYDPEVKKANDDYQAAWKRAMADIAELQIKTGEGQTRPATGDDLLALVNTTLGEARSIADEVFGPFANDVMAYRNEIRRIFDARQAKLNELRTSGSEREKQRAEAHQKVMSEVSEFVRTTYEKANQDAAADEKHGQFFRPKEGDTEWNARLERGFKLVDEAYALNPMDPRLNPDQRVQIIRKHAAVRNRAAAYGPLRYAYEQALKALSEREAELKKYKESTPPAAGRAAPQGQVRPRGLAGLMTDLEKIARPG